MPTVFSQLEFFKSYFTFKTKITSNEWILMSISNAKFYILLVIFILKLYKPLQPKRTKDDWIMKDLEMLQENLKSSVRRLALWCSWVSQQNNDPGHSWKVVKELLIRLELRFCNLEASQSPDLNHVLTWTCQYIARTTIILPQCIANALALQSQARWNMPHLFISSPMDLLTCVIFQLPLSPKKWLNERWTLRKGVLKAGERQRICLWM